MLEDDIRKLMDDYLKIFFACHTRHVRDPRTRRLVSAHQARILDHLDEKDPTSLTELARHMGVTADTMSVAMDRLVKAGYVRRDRDPQDGRRVWLRLSSAGVRVRETHRVLDPELAGRVLARLTPRQRAQAHHGLHILATAGRERPQTTSAAGRPSPHGGGRTSRS